MTLLRQARAACERIIVGLNSDASVRRLKGKGRPAQTAAARATVMASMVAVDLVVVSEEDTPQALIEAPRPDILVKGSDYARADVVGGDFVESYGGHVLVPALGMTFVLRSGEPPSKGQYIREESLSPPYRVIAPGARVTQDNIPSRLNVEIDDYDRVVGLHCG